MILGEEYKLRYVFVREGNIIVHLNAQDAEKCEIIRCGSADFFCYTDRHGNRHCSPLQNCEFVYDAKVVKPKKKKTSTDDERAGPTP